TLAPPAPLAPRAPLADVGAEQLGLHQRVTLLDAGGRYLAGRAAGREPGARRPIAVAGATVGYLLVARAARPSDAMAAVFLAQLKDSLLLIVAASVALSALAAVLLAAHFRHPIQRLADGARALAEGRLDTRLDAGRSDELGQLAHSFNGLARQLAGAEDARRQWVADTSHELRTPLSVLRAQLEAIEDGVRSASPETVAAMLRQVMSLNKLIDELYTLARADVGALACQRQRLDLWRLACEQAEAFGQKLGAAGLALELGGAPARATVLADPERMRQVLANLLENSVRYSDAGGRVRLHAHEDEGRLVIVLDDGAPAVPEAALARLAERFYRVDSSRDRALGGAGLGLALCQRIVEAHGGALDFAHSPLGGLRVRFALALEA
ncbi:ATP-binding protein, partial [Massilia glaciei]